MNNDFVSINKCSAKALSTVAGCGLLAIGLLTVSGQNTIGIYITPLVLIQPTDVEQNAVNNNWLLKLQPAVKLQSWQKSNFHQIE